MKVLLQPANLLIDIDLEDLPIVGLCRWSGRSGRYNYLSGRIDGKNVFMHRLIMRAPENFDVDHIDGNGLNNSRSNLRVCTRSQNLQNRHMRDGRVGIWQDGDGRWTGQMTIGDKRHWLGRYDTEDHAKAAWDYVTEFCRPEFGGKHGVSTEGFDLLSIPPTLRKLIAKAA